MKAVQVLASSAVAVALFTHSFTAPPDASANQRPTMHTDQQDAGHPYAGMWVTRDGNIRHELLPNGRYDEARGSRQSAYRGRYEVRGNEIFYWDDTGFTADGVFVDRNQLHHGGMTFFRKPQRP